MSVLNFKWWGVWERVFRREGWGLGGRYRMCGWEFCDCDVGGGFVGFEGFVCAVFAFVAKSEFSEVAVIISFPT